MDTASHPIGILSGKTSPSSLGLSKSGWEIALRRARWELFRPVVSPISTPTCITTRWPAETLWSKSTARLLCSSTTLILTTIQAVRNNRFAPLSKAIGSGFGRRVGYREKTENSQTFMVQELPLLVCQDNQGS